MEGIERLWFVKVGVLVAQHPVWEEYVIARGSVDDAAAAEFAKPNCS
jgi:hypothetical protein